MQSSSSGGADRVSPIRSELSERLLPAVSAANVGFWDWDLRTNEVFYSPEWKRQIGFEDREVGNTLSEWQSRVHPDDLDRVLQTVRDYLDHRLSEYQVEFRFRHKNGSYRWILAQGALLADEQNKPARFLGVHVDITRHREALRESEELYRITLENISDTVLVADDTGKLCYVCSNVAVIFGYSPAEALALGKIEKLLGADVFDPKALAAKGELPNIERQITAKNGEKRILLVNVKRVSIRGGTVLYTCRDITLRKRTEDVLKSLVKGISAVGEEFFLSLVRELAMALGVRYAFVGELLSDAPDHVRAVATWADGKLAENFEYALAGTPCENVMNQSLCFYPAEIQKAFPRDTMLVEMGAVSYMGTPLFGSTGQPLGLIAVLHDQPMLENELAKSVLTAFAARAGAELERLRTDRALRRSEELFRAVVEDQTEMIVRWTPDGNCTFVNQAYCHAVGKRPQDLIHTKCFPSIAPVDPNAIQQRVQALTPDRPVATHIHESTSPAGKTLWEEWTDRGRFDASGRLIELQSIGRDITERRRAEIRIRQLNRVYAVLSSINETIVREDDLPRLFASACRIAVERGGFLMAWVGLTDARTGKLEPVAHAGASPATVEVLKQIFGDPRRGCAFTSHAVSIGEHAACNNIALDPKAASWRDVALERGYRSMVALPLKVGNELVGTFNLYAGEAGFFDEQELQLLDELAMDIGFAVQVGRTESERRRAETARAESEERFRQLTETIQEVFWMTDPAKTQTLYISPTYETIWGRTCQSLYDSPLSWTEAIHPEDRERVVQDVAARQARGDFDEEYRIVRPDGRIRSIRERAFPVRDANGQISRLVGVARDVTERRQLEEQLRQSQKMEAIGLLAGGVAHDFNNILAAIIMQAELASSGENVPAEARDGFEQIRVSAVRAASLTRQLLLFSRRQVLQPQQLNLNEIVASFAKMLQRIIGEDIRLQIHLHPAPLMVSADAGMLDQVIMNLAVNARDAMPEGGRLLIETSEKVVDAAFARLHPDAAPGRYCCLVVSDTGSGIPPDVVPRIFEPFFTTKPPGKGTGLGLATVHGIAKQHRGWVHVYTEIGKGSCFQVCLPALEGSARKSQPAASPPKPRGGTETILIVEDEQPVRTLMRAMLERHGYRVLAAAGGEEAIRLWQQHRDEIALLVTDIVMPGEWSGQRLARQLQAEKPKLKVIFVSGYSAELAGRELDLRTGENFLQKPFGPDQILETIRQCLDG